MAPTPKRDKHKWCSRSALYLQSIFSPLRLDFPKRRRDTSGRMSSRLKSSLPASGLTVIQLEPRCDSRCCPSLRLRRQFRSAEEGATVACPATAQQGAGHKSDHSNKFVARLLVRACSPQSLPAAIIGYTQDEAHELHKLHKCTYDIRATNPRCAASLRNLLLRDVLTS